MTDNTLGTATYGLIGYPLAHSFSQKFFTDLFEKEGVDLQYANFELPRLDAAALYTLVLMNPCLHGFNVTAPYKEAIIPFLDRLCGVAAEIGAVNTVKILRAHDGRVLGLEGYNTDVEGFRESIAPLLTPSHRRALVLGTGGASKAAAKALEQLGLEVTKVSRTKSPGVLSYADLDEAVMAAHSMVVNCTPLGTYPRTETYPPIPYQLLAPGSVCFDMVYNPEQTQFMLRAAAQGATVKNGHEMLCRQALASRRIWEEV